MKPNKKEQNKEIEDVWAKHTWGRDKFVEEYFKLEYELKKVKQHNRNMMNVLSDVEWVEEVLHPSSCPWCNEGIKIHSSDCRLNKVLNGSDTKNIVP